MKPLIVPLAAALTLLAAPASAQPMVWTPPLVATDPLTKTAYARVPPDEVEVAGSTGFAERLQALQEKGGVQRQDVAMIRVEVRGQWFLSLETTAKEKAAGLGANFLVTEASQGGEEFPGSFRLYRAVRLQRYDGVALYTRPREAVEGTRAARPAAAAPAFQPLRTPLAPPSEPREDLEWLWLNRRFVVSHRLGVDLSGIAGPAWKDLENTVLTRFPEAEHRKLLDCYQRGSKIVLDLKRKTLGPAC
ncbi:MAG: hypothetical protein M0D55_12580 [Elusimicrobiota bacterium]|nr:MAG: hypothetical protein M0D55_12580 [Elusimicrobiota bacterium]